MTSCDEAGNEAPIEERIREALEWVIVHRGDFTVTTRTSSDWAARLAEIMSGSCGPDCADDHTHELPYCAAAREYIESIPPGYCVRDDPDRGEYLVRLPERDE